jgi:hypothetical protein
VDASKHLQVDVAAVSVTVPVSAAALPLPANAAQETGGNLAAQTTALQIIDDWDETDRAKVNLIAGQAGITAGAGTVAANTPRVTHASNDPVTTAVQLIDDAIVTDNAAFADGTTKLDMAGFIFDETAGTALTENDAAAARVDSKRAQVHVLEDATTRGLRQGVVDETGASAVDAAAVGGGTPHDAVDSGNPVKIGGKVTDYTPDSGGREGVAVAAGDRANGAFNLYGELVTAVNPAFFVPSTIATTYNGTTTTATSGAIAVHAYREAMLQFDLTEAGSGTSIVINVLGSGDGTNYAKIRNDGLGSLVFSDSSITSAPSNTLKYAITFRIPCHFLKIEVVATNTDNGGNTITLANPILSVKT